jgi:hypothetical protein
MHDIACKSRNDISSSLCYHIMPLIKRQLLSSTVLNTIMIFDMDIGSSHVAVTKIRNFKK